MATRTMNRLLGAVASGLAIGGGNIAAGASISLPAEQMSGVALARSPLNEVKAAVVTVTITGRSAQEKNSRQGLGRAADLRDLPTNRQIRATGSGVIIDAQQGLVFTNNQVVSGAGDIITTSLTDARRRGGHLADL